MNFVLVIIAIYLGSLFVAYLIEIPGRIRQKKIRDTKNKILRDLGEGKLGEMKLLITSSQSLIERVRKWEVLHESGFKSDVSWVKTVRKNHLCPDCGEGALVERTGKYGKFYGCSRYPKCTYKTNKKNIKIFENDSLYNEINSAYSNGGI